MFAGLKDIGRRRRGKRRRRRKRRATKTKKRKEKNHCGGRGTGRCVCWFERHWKKTKGKGEKTKKEEGDKNEEEEGEEEEGHLKMGFCYTKWMRFRIIIVQNVLYFIISKSNIMLIRTIYMITSIETYHSQT